MPFGPDFVTVIHSVFVAFVIFGFALVVTGDLLRWRWTDNLYFRAIHFLAIGFVTLRTWIAVPCPLTVLEAHLRNGSQAGAGESPLARILHRCSFIGMSDREFKIVVTTFAAMVVLEVLWTLIWKRRYDSASR
ncbi:MAG TPA: DUF2784 family protein [Tepidisphaeraceae bacterium]|nr:DUF2784 family protein [Tepidisphaeraceae bacterium]